ncbi:MAG: threonine dehydratase [Alphaproteobacteria bacterium]|nr:threonine dehydratase [Alphaproteobacteria bacterium]
MRDELTLEHLEAAVGRIARHMAPTPQILWPSLSARYGCEVWVKHENHTPAKSFKLRGALNYVGLLRERRPCIRTVAIASGGNHGHAVGLAAKLAGMTPKVVTPTGASPERNTALRALGVEVIESGGDEDEAQEQARLLAATRNFHLVPSFHKWLVQGAASCGLELLRAAEELEAVLVPIGSGVGICGMIAARDALGLKTRIIGVVALAAPTYALSFRAGRAVSSPAAATIAEALCRSEPEAEALPMILDGAADVVTVSDDRIRAAMAEMQSDTGNVAEPAGAVALAGLTALGEFRGRSVGVVLTGGRG